uniref:Glycosyltransferase family 92 protein n=1 Tax=Caenorhabditis japonica TaxID=281687 RepID=A0A8R1E1T9_CAEJA
MPRLTASRLLLLIFCIAFVCIVYYLPGPSESDGVPRQDYGVIGDDKPDDDQFKLKEPRNNSQVKFLKLDDNAYALSAFTDERNGNMGYKFVRVMMTITSTATFECIINGQKSDTVSLYEFSENHMMTWQLFILNCKLPDGVDFHQVDAVEISRNEQKNKVRVPISYRIRDEKSLTPDEYSVKMSICVPALFGSAYDAKRIVEFLELNTLQGINRVFIYYNPSEILDEKTLQTLDYYAKNGLLELVEFKLPFEASQIWYHGQLAAVTDCLLRNTGFARYTFFHDIDEFFVPVDPKLSLYETVSKLFEDPTSVPGSEMTEQGWVNPAGGGLEPVRSRTAAATTTDYTILPPRKE